MRALPRDPEFFRDMRNRPLISDNALDQ